MKKLQALLIVVLMLITLTGCKGTELVSEEQILTDLQQVRLADEHDVTVDSVTVVERKTDTENKTDTVYVTVEASNDDIACTLSYELIYHLYDQGWSLEDHRVNSAGVWEYKPLKGVAQETAWEKINRKEAVLVDETIDLEQGLSRFLYSHTEEAQYRTLKITTAVEYKFSPYSGQWKYESKEEIGYEAEWDLLGDWVGREATRWYEGHWGEGYVVSIEEIGADYIKMIIKTPEGVTKFDGTLDIDPKDGVEYFVKDGDNSFHLHVNQYGVELEGTGFHGTRTCIRK